MPPAPKSRVLLRISDLVSQISRNYAEEKKKRVTRFTVVEHQMPHMNELPCPLLPWRAWYLKKQARYNMVLGIGVAWFAFSAGLCIATGCMYLNWTHPLEPAPKKGASPIVKAPPCDMAD